MTPSCSWRVILVLDCPDGCCRNRPGGRSTPPRRSSTQHPNPRRGRSGIDLWRCCSSCRTARVRTVDGPPTRRAPTSRRARSGPAAGRRPASRREDLTRLGDNTLAIPRRPLGRAVPASPGKPPSKTPTQPLHARIIDRTARSVEAASPWRMGWASKQLTEQANRRLNLGVDPNASRLQQPRRRRRPTLHQRRHHPQQPQQPHPRRRRHHHRHLRATTPGSHRHRPHPHPRHPESPADPAR
jgi:hypothetical protein